MGVGLNKTVKVCSNDYAEPPEGIPVWCVEQDLSLEAGIQLGLEAILLIVVFLVFRDYILPLLTNYIAILYQARQGEREKSFRLCNILTLVSLAVSMLLISRCIAVKMDGKLGRDLYRNN